MQCIYAVSKCFCRPTASSQDSLCHLLCALAIVNFLKFLKCVVTEVVLFSVVAFKTLTFNKVV